MIPFIEKYNIPFRFDVDTENIFPSLGRIYCFPHTGYNNKCCIFKSVCCKSTNKYELLDSIHTNYDVGYVYEL